jgi:hypothetical protein
MSCSEPFQLVYNSLIRVRPRLLAHLGTLFALPPPLQSVINLFDFAHTPDMLGNFITADTNGSFISIWRYSCLLYIRDSDPLSTPNAVKIWLIQKSIFHYLLHLLATHILVFKRLNDLFAQGARAFTVTRPLLNAVVVVLMCAAVEAHLLQSANIIQANCTCLALDSRRHLSQRLSVCFYFLNNGRS